MLPTKFPETDGLRVLFVRDAACELPEEQQVAAIFDDCFDVTKACANTAMKLIRQQVFEVAIVRDSMELAATDFVPMLLEVGPEDLAVVVVGDRLPVEFEPLCLALDVDAYQCLRYANAELLRWKIHRAVERRRMAAHSQRWTSQQAKRSQEESQDAIHHVRALRGFLLETDAPARPPEWLVRKFLELLRAYVVSLAVDWNDELAQLVDGLRRSHVSLCEALMAHSLATEQLLLGMGRRPGRRVLDRSQMLAYALVVQFQGDGLAEPIDCA